MIFSAERHKDRRRSYGGVERLSRAFLRTVVEFCKFVFQRSLDILAFDKHIGVVVERIEISVRFIDEFCRTYLFYSVGVQEVSGNIHYGFVFIKHSEPSAVGNFCHNRGVEVFLVG